MQRFYSRFTLHSFSSIWLILVFLFIIPTSFRIIRFLYTPLITEKVVYYQLKSKSNIYHLTADFLENGLLQNPRLFLLLGYFKEAVDTLKTGEYELSVGTTPIQCLEKMKAGKVLLHRFTIVEGWTLQQVIDCLEQDTRFKHNIDDNFLESLQSSGYYPNITSLEGLFFSESYDYPRGTSTSHILKNAFELMHKKLAAAWKERDPGLPWKSYYEALIAASLVEKETAIPEERAKIAAVIIKRLRCNMPLQIDASIVYGLGKDYTGSLKKSDLKRDTPYNTYKHYGLPATPIAMPSFASIQAVLHPAKTTALYFVTSGDNGHVFSDSLKEHNRAVAKHRLKIKLQT